MTRRLARLFSALSLALLLAAAWLIWAPAPVMPPAPPPQITKIDRIVIEKAARRMTVCLNGQPVRTYTVALGFAPTGDKTRQGDGKTPEGRFHIDRKNPGSAYYRSLGINYPRPEDRARARAAGLDPGGDIFIHGQPNQRPNGETLPGDWTAGCIAISDAEMAALFAATDIGTPVEIRP
ncbi:murein L,D-transpeptidase family protein [Paracoccus sp. (in: a-proteobacteria)]|uniref:L,D-transpeptidase family protein n=1 Tax=Paracoccus sp. TaxID=267 RepID=UPI0026E00F2E|nr:L,D-transpeptidase family protein [Paracoccus sp. (in: a-proteobacteria)]MDO5648569.1 L,D-transpeptidase family protein [Paracoccus sp. (in: a-proteobacteria)]